MSCPPAASCFVGADGMLVMVVGGMGHAGEIRARALTLLQLQVATAFHQGT